MDQTPESRLVAAATAQAFRWLFDEVPCHSDASSGRFLFSFISYSDYTSTGKATTISSGPRFVGANGRRCRSGSNQAVCCVKDLSTANQFK
jgi:hypothetical protein